MIKKVYTENIKGVYYQKEKEIDYNSFIDELEVYLNNIRAVNICTTYSKNNGIAIVFNNNIEISEKCICKISPELTIIEFQKFKNEFSITPAANITFNASDNKMYLNDFNITIYFLRRC